MRALKSLLMIAVTGGIGYFLMETTLISNITKLGIVLVSIVGLVNYETGNLKDELSNLNFRIDLLERELRDRNYID